MSDLAESLVVAVYIVGATTIAVTVLLAFGFMAYLGFVFANERFGGKQ